VYSSYIIYNVTATLTNIKDRTHEATVNGEITHVTSVIIRQAENMINQRYK